METFEANGKTWATDEDTLRLLEAFRAEKNDEMVGATFELGKAFGRIVEAK
ncbi:hypothetical protein [Hafnia paralvei]|jgi:hypothetical protein|uniref:hypothetical protein n=1 Tax=Hafnia paralvei TaxID=546367 RepID=UPI0001F06F08|nr:hypothetical protein [Hafnia paralvei]EFV40486.1 hypothetical protein HMPREF0864_02217 [Enterobacteriaceae bacterium 9_2_54FAA]